jgi:opacity protein-like surface antigen
MAAAVGGPALASAQPAPDLPEGDGWASVGWQIVSEFDAETLASYDEQRVIGSAGAGDYWAPRLKVEFDAATTSRSSFNLVEQVPINGEPGIRYSQVRVRTTSFAATQIYELLSNAWFTPYVGGGVEVSRVARETHIQAFSLVGPTGPRIPEPPESLRPGSRVIVRPLISVGFKAYLSRRAFFRTDSRLTLEPRVEHYLLRFGFGVDF